VAGGMTAVNNAREAAVDVAPGRIGVVFLSAGLNWDASFIRRALLGDSSLEVVSLSRERQAWTSLDGARGAEPPGAALLRGKSVVILDALAPAEASPAFDQAITGFLEEG